MGSNAEATKSEPDKNTYLVFKHGLHGADAGYDYGTHFLFQGHEGGRTPRLYFTRVNLDADGAHRVTCSVARLNGNISPPIDGSTWDPFARKRLLFTVENESSAGGIWQAAVDIPSTFTTARRRSATAAGRASRATRRQRVAGRGHRRHQGTSNKKARQPNSFVYRFVPPTGTDLTKGGKLQALQVIAPGPATPIVFQGASADADVVSDNVKDLHTYGKTFQTHWVTVHDSAVDGRPRSTPTRWRRRPATPFKRPENGVFRPGGEVPPVLLHGDG